MFVELDSVISCTGSVCNFFFLDGGGGWGWGDFIGKKKQKKNGNTTTSFQDIKNKQNH